MFMKPFFVQEKVPFNLVTNQVRTYSLNEKPSDQKEARKLFVGGLCQGTKEKDIEKYFSNFGEVAQVQLMYDRKTNVSRRFGFVTMSEKKSVEKIMLLQPHYIHQKQIECKLAMPKSNNINNSEHLSGYSMPEASYTNSNKGNYNGGFEKQTGSQQQFKKRKDSEFTFPVNAESCREEEAYMKKLFLGGLKPSIEERDLVEFFISFGEISECYIKRQQGVSRRFGFLIFMSSESVTKVLDHIKNGVIKIKGHVIECKPAVPRTDLSKAKASQDFHSSPSQENSQDRETKETKEAKEVKETKENKANLSLITLISEDNQSFIGKLERKNSSSNESTSTFYTTDNQKNNRTENRKESAKSKASHPNIFNEVLLFNTNSIALEVSTSKKIGNSNYEVDKQYFHLLNSDFYIDEEIVDQSISFNEKAFMESTEESSSSYLVNLDFSFENDYLK
mmetsp:Transcript_21856/g.22778  ORF Transcript_21856/g.22778 Transcript_21856/m.22778 type:complete len:449 (+) Transcript_21856:12-1358(+)